ncbi:MAG: nucleotide exchange factor GrpE [Dysgonamonadaceae bacterium]|jgi:molecular chaperone GrpE|nr:nucleotide exchange factor GrpE [Dysgonamonadaceae bacterium]
MSKNKWKNRAENDMGSTDRFSDNDAREIYGETPEMLDTETVEDENAESTDNMSDEMAKLNDSYIRLMAEYDNYRKRTMKEKADLIKNGGEKVLIGLLPVVDDFERAMKTIETATDVEAMREGVSLIYSKFQTYLQQNGVKPIESNSREFNPDTDDAIAAIPAADEAQKGKIIETIETGYLLNDKVIRHAKVVVAN